MFVYRFSDGAPDYCTVLRWTETAPMQSKINEAQRPRVKTDKGPDPVVLTTSRQRVWDSGDRLAEFDLSNADPFDGTTVMRTAPYTVPDSPSPIAHLK